MALNVMSPRFFVSQPMNGKTEQEIEETREKAILEMMPRGYILEDSYFKEEFKDDGYHVENRPIWFLAKSLDKMSHCAAAYFCKGWENARGCRIEHEVAKEYGLTIFYEEEVK